VLDAQIHKVGGIEYETLKDKIKDHSSFFE
jgi:hypothetical protein